MSRQLEVKQEERSLAKQVALIKALEFGLVGALEGQGIELLGIAFKYDPFNVLMTIKADIAGVRSIAFVGSDTFINCILKADSAARRHSLTWRADKYHQNSV
ncbi:MAG: hypothetical protein KAJ55_08785 [Anaerolineales bacterium]|nr:hypothetical protein [Anaerolineales bacterium]